VIHRSSQGAEEAIKNDIHSRTISQSQDQVSGQEETECIIRKKVEGIWLVSKKLGVDLTPVQPSKSPCYSKLFEVPVTRRYQVVTGVRDATEGVFDSSRQRI